MTARAAILANIRRSLGVTGEEIARNATVSERLLRTPKGVIPARGQLPVDERLALFAKMAEAVSASVERITSSDDVPGAVTAYLNAHGLPAMIRMGDDPLLAGLPWELTQIRPSRGASDGGDPVGLSHAFAGVAETGTLLVASGPDNPTTLNFLPETHIAVVQADAVVGDYEAAWALLRKRLGKWRMPRAINMITGPSRSADIEQTILLGAHGPRRLHIIVVG